MKYKITHTTKYAYTEAVPVCHNQVRLSPRETDHQWCLRHRLLIDPAPAERSKRTDYFGNQVEYFSIHEPHRGLTVVADSTVDVAAGNEPPNGTSAGWETTVAQLRTDRSPVGLDAYQYAFNSQCVKTSRALADYAAQSFATGRPLREAARDLTGRIHGDFVYDPKATSVHTPLEEVFANRRGVCQDFAHVAIGCLRSLGMAARYVSGYVCTRPPPGMPRLLGADASHAWVSVFDGEPGWIDLDPTNNVVVGDDHVTIAWGRDYCDVSPIQGVIVGGGQHSVSVAVDVIPL